MSPEQAQTFSSILMLVVMFAIFYFMLIRPQKKKEMKLREMIAALKVGDEVASVGGIRGKVAKIKDDVIVLETGIGTTKSFIALESSAISRLIKEAPAKSADVAPIPDDVEEETEA